VGLLSCGVRVLLKFKMAVMPRNDRFSKGSKGEIMFSRIDVEMKEVNLSPQTLAGKLLRIVPRKG